MKVQALEEVMKMQLMKKMKDEEKIMKKLEEEERMNVDCDDRSSRRHDGQQYNLWYNRYDYYDGRADRECSRGRRYDQDYNYRRWYEQHDNIIYM